MNNEFNISRYTCTNCGKSYDKSLRSCPSCGYINPKQKTETNWLLKIIKWFWIIFGAVTVILLVINGTKAVLIPPSDDMGVFYEEYKLLSGQKEMTLFGGFMLVWTLFMILIIWAIPVLIIALIIHFIRKSNKQNKEMFEKAHELDKKKYELENQKYTGQKIVRCEYCGKLTRFNNGSCPHCGAKLNSPK